MTASVETERWTTRHDWQIGRNVYTSNPPKYDFRCKRCDQKIRAAEPPKTECPGRKSEARKENAA